MEIIKIQNVGLLTKALLQLKTINVKLDNGQVTPLRQILAKVVYITTNLQQQIILDCMLGDGENYIINLIDFTKGDEQENYDFKRSFHQGTLTKFFYHWRYPDKFKDEGLILDANDCGDWGWSLSISLEEIMAMKVKYEPQDLNQVKKLITSLIK